MGVIQNIWAVGRNYGDHAKELGNQVPSAAAEPMIFLKAGSCVVENGMTFPLPAFSKDIHHECEIALQFGPNGEFTHITLALDLTARDIQNKLKAASHPWTLAKSFANACPLGPLVAIPKGTKLQDLKFTFKINGDLRQTGDAHDMIHPIEKLRLYVLERFPVKTGDLLLTGTPSGVGLLKSGDRLEAQLEGLVTASWIVA